MAGSGAAKCGFIVLDALAILLLMIPVALFRLPGVQLPVFMRGFFCNDQSLMYPYNDSTVPSMILYSVGIALPLITIILTELVIFTYRKRQDAEYLPPETMNKCCGGLTIPPLIYNLIKYAVLFLFGTLITQITFDVTKNAVGRLRPHFFDICKPDFDMANCTDGYIDYFVTEDVCTGTDEHRIYEARRSFPSGHAALSVYFMMFLALYLQKRWTWSDTTYLRPLIQFVSLMMALYVCLSRISDYKHHWSDVFGGAVMGATVAASVVCMISENTTRFHMDHTYQALEPTDDIQMTGMTNLNRRGRSNSNASTPEGYSHDLVFMEMNPTNKHKTDPGVM